VAKDAIPGLLFALRDEHWLVRLRAAEALEQSEMNNDKEKRTTRPGRSSVVRMRLKKQSCGRRGVLHFDWRLCLNRPSLAHERPRGVRPQYTETVCHLLALAGLGLTDYSPMLCAFVEEPKGVHEWCGDMRIRRRTQLSARSSARALRWPRPASAQKGGA